MLWVRDKWHHFLLGLNILRNDSLNLSISCLWKSTFLFVYVVIWFRTRLQLTLTIFVLFIYIFFLILFSCGFLPFPIFILGGRYACNCTCWSYPTSGCRFCGGLTFLDFNCTIFGFLLCLLRPWSNLIFFVAFSSRIIRVIVVVRDGIFIIVIVLIRISFGMTIIHFFHILHLLVISVEVILTNIGYPLLGKVELTILRSNHFTLYIHRVVKPLLLVVLHNFYTSLFISRVNLTLLYIIFLKLKIN